MRTEENKIIKCFELFPLLMVKGLPKNQKRMREVIVLNPNGTFSIAAEGMEEDNGDFIHYMIRHDSGFANLQDLCKFIMVPYRELISLN